MAKGKSQKKDDNNSSEKGTDDGKKETKGNKDEENPPRDPYVNRAEGGLAVDADMPPEQQQAEQEDAMKKFGPCHFDVSECRTAILMLQTDETHIVIGALNCLQKFLKKRAENCDICVELNGMPVLGKLINSENPVIQRLSLKCMTLLSKLHKAKLAMRDMELIQDFVILAVSTDEVVQEYVSLLMSNLATLYTGRLQLIQNMAFPILLQLLEHPDADIIRNAIEAIWRIMEDPLNLELLLSVDTLKPIIKLIDSDYPAVQILAMSVLQRVAQLPKGTELLDSLNVIDSLGGKLGQMEMGDLHRIALKTLINMTQSSACCSKMSDILDHLLFILQNTPDVKTLGHALKLTGKISCVGLNAKSLLDNGFGEKLIEFLACDDMAIVATAAMAAAQISTCDFRASKILTDGIESLLDYADHKDVTRQGFEDVTTTLSHVLGHGKDACRVFLEWGGKDLLGKIIKNVGDYSDDVIISAMTCIFNLSLHFAIRPYIAEEDVITSILKVIDVTNNPQVIVAAATAFTGLLCEPVSLVAFLNARGDKQLIKMIQHHEYPVVAAVVPIIHTAGIYEDVATEMIDRGVLEEMWKRADLVGTNGPLRTAFERLLCSNLSAKFAIAGHLDPFEKLPNGFYDYGEVKTADDFVSISQIKYDREDARLKKIIYLNSTTRVPRPVAQQNPIFNAMLEKNDTTHKIIEEIRSRIQVDEVKREKDLVRIIARVVADNLGGIVDKWRTSFETEELEIANLQSKYDSAIVPLTMMTTGAHRPRAILFKAMADAFGIPCSLERGGYRKVWNVVLLRSKKHSRKCTCSKKFDEDVSKSKGCIEADGDKNAVFTEKLKRFVVDLIHQPGSLLPFHSYEANSYCFF